jgi:SlyX protein
MQQDISQLSEELYSQQKEIGNLNFQLNILKAKIQEMETNTGYHQSENDPVPPHY